MDGMDQQSNRPPDPSAVNMHHPGCRPSKTTAPPPPFPSSGASISLCASHTERIAASCPVDKVQKVLSAKVQRINPSADVPPSAHQGDRAPFLVQLHNWAIGPSDWLPALFKRRYLLTTLLGLTTPLQAWRTRFDRSADANKKILFANDLPVWVVM